MAVDESVITNFCIEFNLTSKELQDEIAEKFPGYYNEWSLAFKKKNKIPNFFGLIAIQIYNAFLMRNEGYYTENAYRGRLADYLKIYDERLDVLFRDYQDNLWQELKKWATTNNYLLEIPDIGWGKGRYIQYPLSQAILNQEDLKKIPSLFKSVGLKFHELLSFKDFKNLIGNSENHDNCTPHYLRVKNKLNEQGKEKLLYYQIFEFFNNKWDGNYPLDEQNEKTKIVNKNEGETNDLYLSKDLKTITLFNNNKPIKEFLVEKNNLFNSINQFYKLRYDEILIFIKDRAYNDFSEIRYLETENTYIIICKMYSNPYALIKKLDSNYRDYSNTKYGIFEIKTLNKNSEHYYWKSFFSSEKRPYSFDFGLKLSRKTWMVGAGPSIRFDKKTEAWLNGEKLDFTDENYLFSLKDYPVGTYKFKMVGFSPDSFEIKEPEIFACLNNYGWKVNEKESSWEITYGNYQISGFSTIFPIKQEQASVRTWVSALNQKSNTKRNSSIVINAIKQSKYGITKANNNNKD